MTLDLSLARRVRHDGPAAPGLSFAPDGKAIAKYGSEDSPVLLAHDAEIYGEWAVMECPDSDTLEDEYRVFHAPTGRLVECLGDGFGLADARLVATRLAFGFPMRGKDLTAWRANDRWLLEALVAEATGR